MLKTCIKSARRKIIKKLKVNRRLKKIDLKQLYRNLNPSEFKIGLEYERLSLDAHTYKNASPVKLSKIIQQFAKIYNWELIYDNETVIGAFSIDGNSISLEPGSQIEISLAPYDNILEIDNYLSKFMSSLDEIARIYDVIFLGYGISPVDDVENIRLLNKKRYQIMDGYLPYSSNGELSQKMMRKTAGIQINIDYFNDIDAYNKVKFLNIISPFVCAMCANSPFENNELTRIKSQRANVWLQTGSDRCNFYYKNIFSNPFSKFNFINKYIENVLNVPMIYIERNNEYIAMNGKINFKDYLKKGYFNYQANFDDYLLHQSLCFPDIRVKKYIEIRNHDSSTPQIALALCVFYKGLMLNPISSLLKKFDYLKMSNISSYTKNAAMYGMDFAINRKITAVDVLKQLLELSKANLTGAERIYLSPLSDILKSQRTIADLIIDSNISNPSDLYDLLTNITK